MTYPLPAPKPRPRARWFVVGGVLMVLGLVVGGVLFVTTLVGALATDGIVTADGSPARVTAPAGERRMVFVEAGHSAPVCRVTEGSGRSLPVRPVSGEATVTKGATEWRAVGVIATTGDGRLTVTCTPVVGDPAQVRIGAPVELGALGGRILLAVGALVLLGGAGFVILLVTTILWVSRRPGPAAPPGSALGGR